MCSYYSFVFVTCTVGNGGYEFLNILKLTSNCADFECLQKVLCSVSVAIQRGMGDFLRNIFWVCLNPLYFVSQRDIRATNNKPFSKSLMSTEILNLFPSEQNSDRENYSVAATVEM
jgi:hypothetical protein